MAESFWDFSLRTYASDGVADACLFLQDQHGIDVNVLLYCCWYGSTRGEHETAAFEQVLEFTRSWSSSVVKPLRNVRTWMKQTGHGELHMSEEPFMKYRNKIKSAELEAEKMQQLTMATLVEGIAEISSGKKDQAGAIGHNIQHYFQKLDLKMDDEARASLVTIMGAALNDSNSDKVKATVDKLK